MALVYPHIKGKATTMKLNDLLIHLAFAINAREFARAEFVRAQRPEAPIGRMAFWFDQLNTWDRSISHWLDDIEHVRHEQELFEDKGDDGEPVGGDKYERESDRHEYFCAEG
jgi:hypothetical protein